MRLRVSGPALHPLTPALRLLLDAWMASVGWTKGDGLRQKYERSPRAVIVLAVRGTEVEGLGAYLPGEDGSPLVIVRSQSRRKGVGSAILEKLSPGMPAAWACSDSGWALCRSAGVKARRVE